MIAKLAFLATHALRGSKSLKLLNEMASEPLFDRATVLRRQFDRLSRLLSHAERTVPYYRAMFKDLGIRSRDIQSLDDFRALPVLTKDIVREHQRELLSDDFDIAKMQVHHSGGSTGQPLTFYHDLASVAASDAGTYRNLVQAGWQPGEMIAFFWGWNKKLYRMPRLEFEARQWLRRQYEFDSFRAGEEEFDRWVTKWRQIRPKVIYGYASAIAQFASHLLTTRQQVAALRGVFTTAEMLLPQQRADIEAAFGCKVFDCYGSSEVRNIASQCVSGSMHVNADFVILEAELRDSHGEIGQPSPFLVTSLRSFGMPFIRYRNDDSGSLLEGDCVCGGGFPLMKLDIARTSDHFTLADGKLVHGLFFIHRLYGSTGVANFQFHQIRRDHIVLYVVRARSSEGFEDSIARAVSDITSLSPARLTIDVREVAEIPLSANGKHRYVRSDITMSSDQPDLPRPPRIEQHLPDVRGLGSRP